jgi:hypothetical protein
MGPWKVGEVLEPFPAGVEFVDRKVSTPDLVSKAIEGGVVLHWCALLA